MNLEIVFENKNVVLVNKPAMMLSVPPRFADDRPILGHVLQTQLGTQIFPIHRLDYEVSGLILYAKNQDAHRKLNRLFEKREISKYYQALTSKTPQPFFSKETEKPTATVLAAIKERQQAYLDHEEHEIKFKLLRGKKRSFEAPHGDMTHTIVLLDQPSETHPDHHTWVLYPVTGKPHQLRVAMAREGFPILGDELYGSKEKWPEGLALKAFRLSSEHADWKSLDLPESFQINTF